MTDRHREKTPYNEYRNYIHNRNGVPYISAPTLCNYEHWDMDDVVTPNYRRRIANGEIINSPCTLTVTRQRAGGGHYYAYHAGDGNPTYTNSGNGSLTLWLASGYLASGFGPLPSSSVIDSLVQTCKQDCLSNIDKPEYALFEDIGELHETVKFLKEPLMSLRTLAGTFDTRWRKVFLNKRKRFPFKSLAALRTAALAESWLEYRFAVMPLVYTACNLAESYWDVVNQSAFSTKTARASRTGTTRVGNQEVVGSPFTFRRSGDRQVSVRAAIRYQVLYQDNPILARYGLRVKDWPRGLWDLKPLSFMTDRLFNVGDLISGMVNLSDPKIKILAASITIKDNTTQYLQVVSQSSASYSPLECIGDTAVREQFSYSRSPWNPSAADTIPRFTPLNLVNSVNKSADLAALIASAFLGRLGRNASAKMFAIEL